MSENRETQYLPSATEFTHEKIAYHLGGIHEQLKGINARLDKVNGRLDRHDDAIAILESWRQNLKGKISVIAAITSVIVTFFVSVLGFLLSRLIGRN
jgi:hypothetical protein